MTWKLRNIDEALPTLMDQVLKNGDETGSRNGRTKELLFKHIALAHPWERYCTVPGRNVSLPAQIAETMWMLAGRDDIEWLSAYLPRAAEFSDDGKTWSGAYGKRLRKWAGGYGESEFDQLAYVVQLLKEDALTRRAVMVIYDPDHDSQPGKDIPCNNWLHFINRLGKLHLHVTVRSNDLMWGWSGINAFEWSALLEIVAGLVGVQVGELHFSISSLHLYEHHWSRARKIADNVGMRSEGHKLQARFYYESNLDDFDKLVEHWFFVEMLCRAGDFSLADSYIESFKEPMLQEWLRVIRRFWTPADQAYVVGEHGSALAYAMDHSPRPVHKASEPKPDNSFVDYVSKMHEEKHVAYGDSWKRRGEMLGILANIARKVDRLGGSETADETSADTAIDLLVYLIKYRLWLTDQGASHPTDLSQYADPLSDLSAPVSEYLQIVSWRRVESQDEMKQRALINSLRGDFGYLEVYANDGSYDRIGSKVPVVENMIGDAYDLAYELWAHDQWENANATRSWKGYEA